DQNEGHAGAGREHGEQPPKGIETAGRGAEPDDREALILQRRATPRRRTPARPPRSRSGLSRTLFCHMRESTTKLCIAATRALPESSSSGRGQCSALSARLDRPLLLLTRGIVDGTPASLRMLQQIHYQDHDEP